MGKQLNVHCVWAYSPVVLLSYCGRIVVVLWSYCGPIVVLVWSYCGPIMQLLWCTQRGLLFHCEVNNRSSLYSYYTLMIVADLNSNSILNDIFKTDKLHYCTLLAIRMESSKYLFTFLHCMKHFIHLFSFIVHLTLSNEWFIETLILFAELVCCIHPQSYLNMREVIYSVSHLTPSKLK